MNNRQIVQHITKRLRDKGVTVDVQPAVTTNSFYLTFDGGVLKKARVGDHKGKGYNYTYEIGKHVQPPYEVEMTFAGTHYTRYRYTDEQVADLITEVLIMRSNLRAKYGKESYEAFRAKAAEKNSKSPKGRTTPVAVKRLHRSVGPMYGYRTPMEYRNAVVSSPEYAAEQRREEDDARVTNKLMMDAMGPDFDPDALGAY